MEKVVALYIRLSDADIDTGKKKSESESIVNQRKYLESYVKNNGELSSYSCTEYVDDGYSGTNSDRPKFQEMIRHAREGKVQCIVVKDLSRFFRDYTEAGNYLECVFPFLNIRFISINENYDSSKDIYGAGTFDIAIRNIIHSAYSKELSEKVRKGKKAKREKGEFTGVHAPFGYIKVGEKGEKLAVDMEVMPIIKGLFELAIKGNKVSTIARIMNDRGIVTPGAYYLKHNPESKRYNYSKVWTPTMVRNILQNQVYQGDMVSGKREVVEMGKRKTKMAQPIITRNTHQAIISREEACKAVEIIRKVKCASAETKNERIFKSKIKCGHCGRMMEHRPSRIVGDRYKCAYKRYDPKLKCSENMFISKDIEKIVYNILIKYFEIEGLHLNSKKDNIEVDELDVARLKKKIKELELQKFHLYEQYVDRTITAVEYKEGKERIDKGLNDYKIIIDGMQGNKTSNNEVNPYYKLYLEKFQSVSELTREMVEEFIEMIYIKDNEIEIKWKFENIFNTYTENI